MVERQGCGRDQERSNWSVVIPFQFSIFNLHFFFRPCREMNAVSQKKKNGGARSARPTLQLS
jgi:hypothetical protein